MKSQTFSFAVTIAVLAGAVTAAPVADGSYLVARELFHELEKRVPAMGILPPSKKGIVFRRDMDYRGRRDVDDLDARASSMAG